MKVLVIGGGGREHALCWKLAQSPLVKKIYCAPGNAGIAKIASCVDLSPTNIPELAHFAKKEGIDLTVVGPEAPLCQGIVDRFKQEGLRAFGPDQKAAQLEGSKAFCKQILRKYGIPTANFRIFEEARSAIAFVRKGPFPVVVKADGLAAGKGSIICSNEEEAVKAIRSLMEEKIFGTAGERVVVEEFLTGTEASIMAISDGNALLELAPSQDYKRIYDGDIGPNTGGMGAHSPVTTIAPHEYNKVFAKILVPVLHAMRKERTPFKGVLYAGVMFTETGPKVLEFNVRFGDPETQVLMLRLDGDLVRIMLACIEGELEAIDERHLWSNRAAVTVVMASAGYPASYETGFEIQGLEEAEKDADVVVFHAGTASRGSQTVTSGGRVLNVSATGATLKEAREKAYAACRKIRFKGAYFRSDIALAATRTAGKSGRGESV